MLSTHCLYRFIRTDTEVLRGGLEQRVFGRLGRLGRSEWRWGWFLRRFGFRRLVFFLEGVRCGH